MLKQGGPSSEIPQGACMTNICHVVLLYLHGWSDLLGV